MAKQPKSVFFFPNGNTAVCDAQGQICELEESWFLMFVKFLQSKGVKVEDIEEIWLPSGKQAKYLKEYHSWEVKG